MLASNSLLHMLLYKIKKKIESLGLQKEDIKTVLFFDILLESANWVPLLHMKEVFNKTMASCGVVCVL